MTVSALHATASFGRLLLLCNDDFVSLPTPVLETERCGIGSEIRSKPVAS